MSRPDDVRRRALLGLPLAWAGSTLLTDATAQGYGRAAAPGASATPSVPPSAPASAAAAAPAARSGTAAILSPPIVGQESSSSTRLALLIGNRVYPAPFDLPPTHKNVVDLKAALERRGFQVTSTVDQTPEQQRASVQAFAQRAAAAPADATVLYYFTGHGMQVDTENLMLGSGIAPDAAPSTLLSSSLHLKRDVIDVLPRRPSGLTIAVVDACRTSLRAALTATDGFNQMEAPLGCLIVFSTGAGKPAIAPAVETLNTFYTASLVKLLQQASDDISFSDLFRLVKSDVTQTMQNHPVAAIRQFTQIPFIAENTQVKFLLSTRPSEPPAAKFSAEDEAKAWSELQASLWPADVVKLAEGYLQRYPQSRLAGGAQVAREGAVEAARVLRGNEVRLYRSAFQPRTSSETWLAEWGKAARGDKDAAARIGRAYLDGTPEIGADLNRYEGWMQYAAALGNGIASYELAVFYRRQGQPAPASQYEARAKDLGYTPPASLDNQRK